jgi:chorismate dehydratase
MKLRVSFIDFLNSVPLGWGFLHGSHQDTFDILHDVPSECARRLENGEADVGLIPVIEYQRIPGLKVLPGISIASRHEVRSVLFVSRRPLSDVKRVAVDTSSRTSDALLKILMKRRFENRTVQYIPFAPNPERMLGECDAALIIGNPALQHFDSTVKVYDLAQEWQRLTGKPFVFAFWAVRDGIDLGDQVEAFYESKREGLQNLERIAADYSGQLDLTKQEIQHYLGSHLDYSLDHENLGGLETFFDLAAEQNLTEGNMRLDFYPYLERDGGRS